MKLYALTTQQGTAMPETVLIDSEINNPDMRDAGRNAAQAAGDWDGDPTFKDVSDNDAIVSMFD